MKQGIVFLIMVFFVGIAASQSLRDTALILDEVTITGSKWVDAMSTSHKVVPDSLQRRLSYGQSMGSLLAGTSGFYIKSYQPGGLATMSYRGATASQTIVMWNGLPLNNSMNGVVNLANLPIFFGDDVAINTSGNATSWGSGSIGGTVLIDHAFQKGSPLEIEMSAGSNGFLSSSLSAGLHQKKHSLEIRGMQNKSKNDYKFLDDFGNRHRLTHGETTALGLTVDDRFQFSSNKQLEFHGWYQKNDINIPPTISEGESLAKQKDENIRFALRWLHTLKKASYHVKIAHFTENQWYDDEKSHVNAHHVVGTQLGEVEYRSRIKTIAVVLGGNGAFVSAVSDNFAQAIHQLKLGSVMSLKSTIKRVVCQSSLRWDHYSDIGSALTYHIGVERPWRNGMGIKINIDKLYRAPTLNDLYWVPGGNAALKPEHGLAQTLDIIYKPRLKNVKTKVDLGLFNRNIHDWIQWSPQGNLWQPKNVLAVWTRGAELDLQLNFQKHQMAYFIRSNASLVFSTTVKSDLTNDLSLGKQLVYVPKLTGNVTLGFQFHRWSGQLLHQYVGKRFITTDESKFLSPYLLGQLTMGYGILWHSKKRKVNLYLKIENMYNHIYQTIVDRPMPGRQVFFGVKLNY